MYGSAWSFHRELRVYHQTNHRKEQLRLQGAFTLGNTFAPHDVFGRVSMRRRRGPVIQGEAYSYEIWALPESEALVSGEGCREALESDERTGEHSFGTRGDPARLKRAASTA